MRSHGVPYGSLAHYYRRFYKDVNTSTQSARLVQAVSAVATLGPDVSPLLAAAYALGFVEGATDRDWEALCVRWCENVHVRQSFNWDCGIACSTMVLKWMGLADGSVIDPRPYTHPAGTPLWTIDLFCFLAERGLVRAACIADFISLFRFCRSCLRQTETTDDTSMTRPIRHSDISWCLS
jgi:hypothetical protein